MPRFIHLDTSIQSIGGHHWDLASNIADIAHKLGWSASVATNIRFREKLGSIAVAPHINVIPDLNCPVSWMFSNNDMGGVKWQVSSSGLPALCLHPSKLIGTISGLVKSPNIIDTYRTFHSTKQAFVDFLNKENLSNDDMLFFGTACELDVLCFSEALREYSKEINWHTSFYFHYGVFPSTKSSKLVPPSIRKTNIEKMLKRALSCLNMSNISLLATTSQLATQLTELTGFNCRHLDYPINQKFFSAKKSKLANENDLSALKIEVSLAGGFREEQGSSAAVNVLSSIFSDHILNQNIQVSLMVNKGFMDNEISTSAGLLPAKEIKSLRLKQFPLSSSEYFSWLHNANAILFLYRADDYANRVSGVFLEAIALEKPVIVLASSWMSSYLDSISKDYFQNIIQNSTLTRVPKSVGSESYKLELDLLNEITTQILFVLEHRAEFDSELPILKIKTSDLLNKSCPFRRVGENMWACITEYTSFNSNTIFTFSNRHYNSSDFFEKVSYCILDDKNVIPISYAGLVVESLNCFNDALRELILFKEHYTETTKKAAKLIESRHHPKVFVEKATTRG